MTVKDQNGFTLIELLVVTAITVILVVAFAGPATGLFHKHQVSIDSDGLTDAFRRAQLRSINGFQNAEWGVSMDADGYTLFMGSTFLARDIRFDEQRDFGGIVTSGGFTEIVFSKDTGTPSAAGDILLANGENEKKITISKNGKIELN